MLEDTLLRTHGSALRRNMSLGEANLELFAGLGKKHIYPALARSTFSRNPSNGWGNIGKSLDETAHAWDADWKLCLWSTKYSRVREMARTG